jgi:hypothetical protein
MLATTGGGGRSIDNHVSTQAGLSFRLIYKGLFCFEQHSPVSGTPAPVPPEIILDKKVQIRIV